MGELLAIGKVIKMPCMRSGLCKYPTETILVGKDALEKLAITSHGIPVVVEHPDEKITDQNISSIPVVGRVADMHYDTEQEIWLAHFVVDDINAVELLKNGYGVSTAWYGDEYASGGTFNNVSYDRELLVGRYEHLAIVKNPRYEMAVNPLFLNSKALQDDTSGDRIIDDTIKNEKRGIPMIGKIFKFLTTKEEIKTNEGEELVIEIEGVEMSLKDLAAELKDMEGKAAASKRIKLDGETEIEYDGKKTKVNELVKRYQDAKKASLPKDEKKEEVKEEPKKEAEVDPKDEKKDEVKDEKKESEVDPKEEKKETEDKDEEKKTNSRFDDLQAAHLNSAPEIQTDFISTHEKVLIGQSRYGSKK